MDRRDHDGKHPSDCATSAQSRLIVVVARRRNSVWLRAARAEAFLTRRIAQNVSCQPSMSFESCSFRALRSSQRGHVVAKDQRYRKGTGERQQRDITSSEQHKTDEPGSSRRCASWKEAAHHQVLDGVGVSTSTRFTASPAFRRDVMVSARAACRCSKGVRSVDYTIR